MFKSFIDYHATQAIQIVSEKFDYLAAMLSDMTVITEREFNKGQSKENRFIADVDGTALSVHGEGDNKGTIVVCDNNVKEFKKSPELFAYAIGFAAWVLYHDLTLRDDEKIIEHWTSAANIRYEIEYGGHPDFAYFRREHFIDDFRAKVKFEEAPSLTVEEIYDRLVEES